VKPRLVVSLPLVWGVRNVLRSGLAERLGRDFHLVYAIPEEAREDFASEGIAESDTWVLERPVANRRTEWAQRLLHAAHARRHPTPSDDLFEWRRRDRPQLRRRIRAGFFRGAARLASADAAFARLQREEEELFTRSIPSRVWNFLRQTRPVAGLSTSCVVDWERPLFQAMRTLGIPTATHVLSFDNLTSRGYLPLRHFDRFLVWQETMAEELTAFYGVGADRLTMTGTPQFDFHVRPEFRWSRAQTLATLGLPDDRPYLVYCANHFGITPSEPALVEDLLARVGRDARFAGHRWVIRLHPMDVYGRWAGVDEKFANVVLSRPWKHKSDSRFWAIPTAEEVALLGNTLRHADATLTIASTTALDSAVVDTPVVCVGFHPSAEPWEGKFYRDAHFSQHYRPLMESGATPMATDPESLLALLRSAVDERAALGRQRAALVRRLCGSVDGGAVQRIAGAVAELVAGSPSDALSSPRRAGVGSA
jgi:hypothetical protein